MTELTVEYFTARIEEGTANCAFWKVGESIIDHHFQALRTAVQEGICDPEQYIDTFVQDHNSLLRRSPEGILEHLNKQKGND